jgi:hypothetical protein
VFLKVNKNIIRLYSELDPVLGKVLRNLKLAVEKTRLFHEEDRFGETMLIPVGCGPLAERPPLSLEKAEQWLARSVLVHDTMMTMVNKLYCVLAEQNDYQRAIPFVSAALMFKRVYQLAWETPDEAASPDEMLRGQELSALAKHVCSSLGETMRTTYVEKRKISEELFRNYLCALNDILVGEVNGEEDISYFERLKRYLPNLSRRVYTQKHRTILEYLAKSAKQALREELKKA